MQFAALMLADIVYAQLDRVWQSLKSRLTHALPLRVWVVQSELPLPKYSRWPIPAAPGTMPITSRAKTAVPPIEEKPRKRAVSGQKKHAGCSFLFVL